LLDIEHVTAGYGDAVVLRDVTLTVPDAKTVTLLGPNGAGKTTLLRTASGLIKPTSGHIYLDGKDVTGQRPHRMARGGLCHIPEGRGIFPSLSVRDNLILQAPKGEEKETIEEGVASFPILGKRLGLNAGSLSGGEQQMLALVRAKVSRPRLVLVDEPCLGLAPIIVDNIFETLRQIVATGTALLLVEQYVNRALELADTVYLLNRGEVVFAGASGELSAEEIFERYLGVDV